MVGVGGGVEEVEEESEVKRQEVRQEVKVRRQQELPVKVAAKINPP